MLRSHTVTRPALMILAVALSVCLATPANATIWVLQANLDQAQEVPAPTPPDFPIPPSGVAIMHYDDVAKTFSIEIAANGMTLSGPSDFRVLTDSHIHVAPPGVPGPVIRPLGGPPVYDEPLTGFITFSASGLSFPVANEADLLSNNTYVNLHSTVNGPGEIRGQLIVVIPEPASLGLIGMSLGGLLLRRRR